MNANKKLEEKLTKFDEFQTATIESFKQLEEKVEDRTNRQLRKTIVVKGLPEKPNEKWSDTRNILAKHISKSYNIALLCSKGSTVVVEMVSKNKKEQA